MGNLTIFKNKKAFSLVELIIAMLIASIVMLSVYFMLIVAYSQFNDLTTESERFNNLQVFERMFQRSAMTCSYYKIDSGSFYFSNSNNTYEKYCFESIKNDDFTKINKASNGLKSKICNYEIENLSNEFTDTKYKINLSTSYKLVYYKYTYTKGNTEGYRSSVLNSYPTNSSNELEEKVLFDNIVKIYYETSQGTMESNFKINDKNLQDNELWPHPTRTDDFYKIYTPFIKLIIVYKDNRDRLKRSYITCRLRGIEGIELQ